jgi:hypothetical protein
MSKPAQLISNYKPSKQAGYLSLSEILKDVESSDEKIELTELLEPNVKSIDGKIELAEMLEPDGKIELAELLGHNVTREPLVYKNKTVENIDGDTKKTTYELENPVDKKGLSDVFQKILKDIDISDNDTELKVTFKK